MKSISPILRQIDSANALTLLGLILSFFAVKFAIQEQFYAALICTIFAGLTDLFDGLVARRLVRTELQSQAGKQLDSLVDLCSFGFASAIFAYCFGLRDPLSAVVAIAYLSATALRLAYFNYQGMSVAENKEYFTGLPVTYASLFIPLAFTASFFLPESVMIWILNGLYLMLAIAMTSGIKVLKLRGIWYGLFSLGGLTLTSIYTLGHCRNACSCLVSTTQPRTSARQSRWLIPKSSASKDLVDWCCQANQHGADARVRSTNSSRREYILLACLYPPPPQLQHLQLSPVGKSSCYTTANVRCACGRFIFCSRKMPVAASSLLSISLT
jgi:CDP-diacylglycerol--serine O-phosphatidyltransferase